MPNMLRVNRRDNPDWTIQRNLQHWTHRQKTKINTTITHNTAQNTKKMRNTDPRKTKQQKTNLGMNLDARDCFLLDSVHSKRI